MVPLRRQASPADDDTLAAAYLSDLRLHQDRSSTTSSTYESHLGSFRRWLADGYADTSLVEVSAHHVKAFLLHQAAPTTRATMLWAVRSFYSYLLSEEVIPVNPTDKLTVPGGRKVRTEYYTDTQAEAILARAANQTDLRWQVGHPVLATLYYGGLRRDEICNLCFDQVDQNARRMTVTGKGGKTRIVPIPPPLLTILDRYLHEVRPLLPKSPFFFINPRSRSGSVYVGRFNDQAVHKLVKAAGEGAGLDQHDFPHRWRPPTPQLCCGGEPTSTKCSACSVTRRSARPSATCTSTTTTSPKPWTERSASSVRWLALTPGPTSKVRMLGGYRSICLLPTR